MRKYRNGAAKPSYRALWAYASLVVLLGWTGGCGSQDQAETGGYGGNGGNGGAALIQEPSVEDSLVVNDPRWELPEGADFTALVEPSNATA